MKHDRAKHEAMLRRQMMALLAHCSCGDDHAQHVEFCEAFIEMSRPRAPEAQGELFA